LNIDSISEEYLESIFSRVLKRNKKIDFEKITSSALKSYIPYYPIDKEQPLEAFKQKIKEILDKDFDSRHSIIENGMDVYKELSAGFNSQIYFSLIASETRDKGIYIVDQPEDNISQKAIRETVLEDIKEIGYARQVIMVTHNPQFIVNLDVDNVIFLTTDNNELIVQSGALEYECQEYKILSVVAENIDGGLDSISRRLKRYEKGI
jgi:predicted ATP-dependent endonuclease of OLD family